MITQDELVLISAALYEYLSTNYKNHQVLDTNNLWKRSINSNIPLKWCMVSGWGNYSKRYSLRLNLM